MTTSRTVLVTGGTGFIGRHVTAELERCGWTVRTLSRSSARRDNHCALDLVSDELDAAVDGCAQIVHLAGLADASASIDAPVEHSIGNAVATLRLLEAARRANARVILASSQRVYQPSAYPLAEDDPLNPVDPYGYSKLVAEQWATMYSQVYGLPTVILRLFSVYGAGQKPGRSSGVVSIFIREVLQGRPIRVFARQTRDFTDVRDVARAVQMLVENPDVRERVFNVATGAATSLVQLAEMVCAVTGRHVPIAINLEREAESYVADVRRAANVLGFQATIDLEKGLKEYADVLLATR